MKQKITTAIILLISLVGAILIGNWEYNYYPRNRVDIIHPYSNNRAFTRAYGFVDQSIVLCAADWPYTFFSPVLLGDVYSEGYPTYAVYWSKDGAIIGLRIKRNNSEPELFVSAYDFNKHEMIQQTQFADMNDSNKHIDQIMIAHGGSGAAVTGIDDGKITEYSAKFPLVCWFPPILVAAMGACIAIKVLAQPRK